jgi:hypothetical protein
MRVELVMDTTSDRLVAATADDLIILVHGTYAASDADEGASWWQRGSEAWRALSEKLPPGTQLPKRGRVFHWSGDNSERARIKAAQDLLTFLLDLESKDRSYHLIGHSHGGSVIWHALRLARLQKQSLDRLRSWSTVGTPFLQHRTRGAWHVANLVNLVLAILLFRPAYRTLCKLAHLTGSALFGLDEGINLPSDGAPGAMVAARGPALNVLEWLGVSVTETAEGVRLGSFDPAAGRSFFEYLFFSSEGLVILLVALLAAYVYLNLAAFFLSPVLESIRIRKEKRLERDAMGSFGGRWLGIWSSDDEAINGLRATLDLSISFVHRMAPRESVLFSDRLALLSRPYQWFLAPVYNAIFRPLLDGMVRSHVIKTAQGNNRPASQVIAVSPAPIQQEGLDLLPPIPDSLNREIVDNANRYASDIAPKLRKLLAGSSFVSGLEAFGNAISGRELVHTSYFDHPEILDLLAMHIAWSRGDLAHFERASEAKADLRAWFRGFKSQLGAESPFVTGLRERNTSIGNPLIRPRRRRQAA